jgi:hypothetical protein
LLPTLVGLALVLVGIVVGVGPAAAASPPPPKATVYAYASAPHFVPGERADPEATAAARVRAWSGWATVTIRLPDGVAGFAVAANTVATKVAEMQAGMTEGELGRTSYAAAHVTTAEGSTETWVAAAGKSGYVRPAVRGDALNMRAPASADLAGLEHINDAEMHLFRAAEQQGATINTIGATRPVCAWCQARLPSDVPIVTELK